MLTAKPGAGSRIKAWGGTEDDSSKELNNFVVMSANKVVSVEFELVRTIRVPTDYDTIQKAIDAAGEGDQIVLAPGDYQHPGYEHQFVGPHLGGISIWGKNLTITTANPDSPELTRLQGISIDIRSVGPETVLSGFTMHDFGWGAGDGVSPKDGTGLPGENGGSIKAGAINIYNASPTLKNIVIDNVSIQSGSGGKGADGGQGHINGGNGGWAGSAYGGAIFMLNSNPTFKNVKFLNCAAYSGDGGKGGDALRPSSGYGGRGGQWEFKEHDENWWKDRGLEWLFPANKYGYARFNAIYDFENDQWIPVSYEGTYDDYWLFTAMGGAVYIDTNSNPTFTDCIFSNNKTVSGFCGVGGQHGFPPSPFPWPDRHARIQSFGGAVYCEPGSSPAFTNCAFSGNWIDSNVPTNQYDAHITYGGALCFRHFDAGYKKRQYEAYKLHLHK